MKKAVRIAAVVLGATVASCVLAGVAFAAFTPTFSAVSTAEGTTTIRYTQAAGDDAAAKLVFFTPQLFVGGFGVPAGGSIGLVSAKTDTGATLSGNLVTAAGTDGVTVNGAATTVAAEMTRCRDQVDPLPRRAPALTPNFVDRWVAQLNGAQSLAVPIFVDQHYPGYPLDWAGYDITFCLPASPKIVELTLTLQDVFSAPGGWNMWHLRATPYAGAVASTAGVVEAESLDRIPQALTLTSKKIKSKTRLSGRLTAGGAGIGGVTVTITKGKKRVAQAKTNGSGRYAVAAPAGVGSATGLVATARYAGRKLACINPVFAPAPCTGLTYGAFTVTSAA